MTEFFKLKDVCIRITDGAHYSPAGVKNGYPMLSVKDMKQNNFDYSDCRYISEKDYLDLVRGDCKPRKNDVLIAKDGSYLKHVFVTKEEKEEVILSSIGILRPNLNLINPNYLKYYLHTASVKKAVAKKYVSGSALPRIILKNFGEIEIIKKSLTEQQKIAAVLSALDDKIELNNQINTELEAMAKTLYDYWFVQFDFPDENGKPYKSSGGKMVFNGTLKREIPEGWEVKSLYQIAKFINGLACQKFRPENEEDDFLPVIKIREMNDGISNNTEKVRLDIPEKNIINDGDVLFSWSATLDVKIWTEGKAALNQHIFKVVSDKYPRSFYYFETLNYLQHFKMMAELRKTTMGHITIDHLKASYIPIPPINIIYTLDAKLKPILEKIITNKKQNQELAQLRDWLLPMLMNGQVRVGECDEEDLGLVAEERGEYKKYE